MLILEHLITCHPDHDYIHAQDGLITFCWDETKARLQGVYGQVDNPNPNNRDRRYSNKWFNRAAYSEVNDNHTEVCTGHVVGRNLGGLDAGINFIRQHSRINSGKYRQVEMIARRPETEAIAINLIYNDDSQVPCELLYYIQQYGELQRYVIENPIARAVKMMDKTR